MRGRLSPFQSSIEFGIIRLHVLGHYLLDIKHIALPLTYSMAVSRVFPLRISHCFFDSLLFLSAHFEDNHTRSFLGKEV